MEICWLATGAIATPTVAPEDPLLTLLQTISFGGPTGWAGDPVIPSPAASASPSKVQPIANLRIATSLVGYDDASRITAHDGVVGCVVHLVVAIEDNEGLDRPTRASTSYSVAHAKEAGHGYASWRTGHVHIVKAGTQLQTRQRGGGH